MWASRFPKLLARWLLIKSKRYLQQIDKLSSLTLYSVRQLYCSGFIFFMIFSACPSHVSLDISNDSHVLVPVCQPVLTTGITIIKLKLQQPQVAQVMYIDIFPLKRVEIKVFVHYRSAAVNTPLLISIFPLVWVKSMSCLQSI